MATPAQETASSTSEQLKALIRLQHIDNRIDQIKKLRGDLPDEIRDLEDEQQGLETRIENIRQEQAAHETGRSQAVRDVREAEGLIKKYEEQQLQVRNNREYDALTKEIEAQRQRIADAQARTEEIEGAAGTHEVAIAEAEARLEELKGFLETKRNELTSVLSETQQEQELLEAKRQEAAQAVDDRYLRAYRRLRGRLRDGRAVVPLERGAAAGFAIPPQRQMEVRQRNRIIVDEHTGRIIVDSDLYDETVAALET